MTINIVEFVNPQRGQWERSQPDAPQQQGPPVGLLREVVRQAAADPP